MLRKPKRRKRPIVFDEVMTFKIPGTDRKFVDEVADRAGVDRSQIMREGTMKQARYYDRKIGNGVTNGTDK